MLNRKLNCIRCELPICGIPISSKQTEAFYYSGTAFGYELHQFFGDKLETFL